MLTETYRTPLNRAGIAVAGPYTGQPVRDSMPAARMPLAPRRQIMTQILQMLRRQCIYYFAWARVAEALVLTCVHHWVPVLTLCRGALRGATYKSPCWAHWRRGGWRV